jgi:hypothetical protein
MNDLRASNRSTGPSLLDKSTAKPGSVDMSIFEKKPKSGQGTVSSDYLKQTKADNPGNPDNQKSNSVTLSNCVITTDPAKLASEQPFDMSVDVKATDGAASGTVTFNLFCVLPKQDGTEEVEDESSPSQGQVKDGKAIATGKLVSPKKAVEAGTKLKYYVVAQHSNATTKPESPKVEVAGTFSGVDTWSSPFPVRFIISTSYSVRRTDQTPIVVRAVSQFCRRHFRTQQCNGRPGEEQDTFWPSF